MTADYARGQPASAWPLAGQPCRVDCDLHTIARAHKNTFFVRLIGTIGPRVGAVEYLIMCTVHNQNLGPFFANFLSKVRVPGYDLGTWMYLGRRQK